MSDQVVADGLFEDLQNMDSIENVADVDTSVKDVIDDGRPPITSPEWNDYVMSLFEEDELIEGMPLVAGLRRVSELIMGPIVQSAPAQVIPPKDDFSHGRATVIWNVEFQNGAVFGDVADSWEGNTDDKFCAFSVATAATRAEARALRKALRLRKVSADEITNKDTASIVRDKSGPEIEQNEFQGEVRLTDRQFNFLDIKLKQLNIDGTKFFKETYGISSKGFISKDQATKAITKLNEYQNNTEELNPNILGYNPDWSES